MEFDIVFCCSEAIITLLSFVAQEKITQELTDYMLIIISWSVRHMLVRRMDMK